MRPTPGIGIAALAALLSLSCGILGPSEVESALSDNEALWLEHGLTDHEAELDTTTGYPTLIHLSPRSNNILDAGINYRARNLNPIG